MRINIRFVTINKKGKLVKNSRKAKPGVKYHVNRVFKMASVVMRRLN
ncbi:hypothetical protein [Lactobacillus amylovorus]